jgi:hypothetical protein
MFLLKLQSRIAGPYVARQGRVRGQSPYKHRPRPLLLERLENRLCLSTWSDPVNLGPIINSSGSGVIPPRPAVSSDGLSLYFNSDRPGGSTADGLWVSHRASVDDPWGEPQNLGPAINDPSSTMSFVPNLSTDQHWLFFSSDRAGGYGDFDIWASYRQDTHDDLGWQPPINLGPGVNSQYFDAGPGYFEDPATGITTLYFDSNQPGGGDAGLHIYASTLQGFAKFGPAVLVPELSSPYAGGRPTIRSDGLEMFLASNRPGGLGNGVNIWVSTRASTLDPWSTPVTLGAPINMEGFNSGGPALSSDGNTMYFFSNRPGGFGVNDLWMSTRLPQVADHFSLSAPASTTAGQPFSGILTARDHDGNIVTGYSGTVSFTSSDAQAALPAAYTFTAADNGTHTFAGVTLVTAGAQTLMAQDTGNSSLAGGAAVAVVAAPADHFLLWAPPTAASGTPFDVTVTALDPYSNVDANYTGTITWTSSDTDSGVILPASYTFQATDSGTHTFSAGVTLITPGDQTLSATDTVGGITGSATVTVTPSPHLPPGGGAQSPRIPSINAEISPAQGAQMAPQLISVDRLFASPPKAGLLWASRKHDGTADDLFAGEGAMLV